MELFETEVDWRDVHVRRIGVDNLAHFVDREPDGRERGILGGKVDAVSFVPRELVHGG